MFFYVFLESIICEWVVYVFPHENQNFNRNQAFRYPQDIPGSLTELLAIRRLPRCEDLVPPAAPPLPSVQPVTTPPSQQPWCRRCCKKRRPLAASADVHVWCGRVCRCWFVQNLNDWDALRQGFTMIIHDWHIWTNNAIYIRSRKIDDQPWEFGISQFLDKSIWWRMWDVTNVATFEECLKRPRTWRAGDNVELLFGSFYCMKSRHVFWMLFMERCACDSCRNIIAVLDGNSRAVVVLSCLQSGFFSFWLMM